MAIRILSSENITGNLTLSGNQTTGGNAYVTGTSNSLVVISRDNMFVDAGQFYLGADNGTTDDSFRQRTASGSYFIESRKSGTWTNRLQINTAGTLIVQQGMAISGNIDGVGATFIGTAASGAALVTIENNSGSTATSYGLLVLGGGNSSNGRTFEVRDASGNTDLIVKGDGNVGIGTTSPSQKLEVVSAGFAYVRTRSTAGSFTGFDIGQHTGGSIFLNNRDNTAMVFMTNNTERMNILAGGTGTFYNAFSIQGDDKSLIVRNAAGTVIGSMGAESSSTPNVGMTTIRNNGTTTIQFNSNGSSYINGGNVGIGTTSPSNKLDVFAANNYEGIALTDSDETLWNILKSGSSVNTSYFNMFSEGVTKVRIHADNVSYFNGGNVGIGTTSPTLGKLQVAGSGYFGPVGTGNATTKAEMQSNAVLRLKPHDNNSTNMNFAQVNGGGGMGIQVTNGPGTANWDIALSPFGGNVGIGTTSPAEKLTIDGTVSGAYVRISNAGSGDVSSGYMIYNGSNLDFNVYTNPTFGNTTLLTREALAIRAGGSERMRITSAGGISFGSSGTAYGTSGQVLTSNGNAAPTWEDASGGSSPWTISGNNIYNNNSGSVGVNNTSPSSHFSRYNQLVVGNGTDDQGMTIFAGSNDESSINFTDTTSTFSNNFVIKVDHNDSSESNNPSFQINYENNRYVTINKQTTGSSQIPQVRLGIFNSSSLPANLDHSMLEIGITSGMNNPGMVMYGDSQGNTNPFIGMVSTSSSSQITTKFFRFYHNTTLCGTIQKRFNANEVQYLTTSDYRLKEDLKPFKALDTICKINVYNYKWKNIEGYNVNYGVLAHELQELIPEVVDGEKDEVNKKGEEEYQSVDYSKLVPHLIQSIQELKAEIELLKSK